MPDDTWEDGSIDERRRRYQGRLAAIQAAFRSIHRPEVETFLSEELARATKDLGPLDPVSIEIEYRYEEACTQRRGYAESAERFSRLAAKAERAGMPATNRISTAIRSLRAQYLRKSGDIERGLAIYEDEVALWDEHEQPFRYSLARTNLAAAYRDVGNDEQRAEAEVISREEFARRQSIWGNDHSFTWVAQAGLIEALILRAEDLDDGGVLEVAAEALDLARDLRKRRESRHSLKHGATVSAYRLLAQVHLQLGEPTRAVALLRRAADGEQLLGSAVNPGATSFLLAQALIHVGTADALNESALIVQNESSRSREPDAENRWSNLRTQLRDATAADVEGLDSDLHRSVSGPANAGSRDGEEGEEGEEDE